MGTWEGGVGSCPPDDLPFQHLHLVFRILKPHLSADFIGEEIGTFHCYVNDDNRMAEFRDISKDLRGTSRQQELARGT